MATIRVKSVHIRESAEHFDNRTNPSIRITGPAARVRLDVDGREVIVDVAPLELLEFRARIRDSELVAAPIEVAAAALAREWVQSHPSPSNRPRTLPPQAAYVGPADAPRWHAIFDEVREEMAATTEPYLQRAVVG